MDKLTLAYQQKVRRMFDRRLRPKLFEAAEYSKDDIIIDRETFESEKRKWEAQQAQQNIKKAEMKKWEAEREDRKAELKIRTAREKRLEAEERCKEAKLKVEEWEASTAEHKERDRKREAERELPPRRSSGVKFIPRMRCFECGATTHVQINCPQLLGKTAFKPEANVSRVGVGVLRNEPALKE